MGVQVSWVDTSSIEEIKSVATNNTKMILIETPTNPMMQLTDIKEVANFSKHEFKGPDARKFLDHILAGKLPKQGRISLSPMLT